MISEEITNFVRINTGTLEHIDTGGGVDYFGRTDLEFYHSAVVCACDDAGSPESLDEEADLMLWHDENWEQWTRIWFPTAFSAYLALYNMECDSV